LSDPSIGTKNVWPNYAKGNIGVTKQSGGTLGKDDFLQILVTQLKNQDPMQPMEDKEFIAQMAQFSSVEQLTNISTQIGLMRQSLGFASGLIGKSVTWEGTDAEGKPSVQSGIVNAIKIKDGKQYADVNGQSIELDLLTTIANPEEAPSS
jgi:flagellar basal-body rod modification protein FlgD